MSGFSNVVQKLKLGRHYKIERFGVLFCILILCLGFSGAGAFREYQKKQSQKLSDDAVYTTSFKSSLTGIEGEVCGVYVNSDRTRAFVMMRIPDVQNRSLDASDYQVCLSAYRQKLLSRPTGAIYSFGMSGYFGIYLCDVEGFPTQVLDLVVRCNTALKGEVTADETFQDQSFSEFDQFEVCFNPGASKAVYAASLDEEQLQVSSLYKEMVTDAQEASSRSELNSALSKMQLELARIQEYKRRMPDCHLAVPDDPETIAGDTVSGPDDNGDYRLETNYIFPGGFDFHWQGKRITDGGYLKQLARGEAPNRYLTRMAELAKGSPNSPDIPSVYYRDDGSEFDRTSTLLPEDQSAASVITGLETSWQSYHTMKREYQMTLLRDLLLMEYQSDMTDEQFTVNDDSSLFTLWNQVR